MCANRPALFSNFPPITDQMSQLTGLSVPLPVHIAGDPSLMSSSVITEPPHPIIAFFYFITLINNNRVKKWFPMNRTNIHLSGAK